jgi:hypothetical protein
LPLFSAFFSVFPTFSPGLATTKSRMFIGPGVGRVALGWSHCSYQVIEIMKCVGSRETQNGMESQNGVPTTRMDPILSALRHVVHSRVNGVRSATCVTDLNHWNMGRCTSDSLLWTFSIRQRDPNDGT